MVMSEEERWFGYLDAGSKSSPVVRDLTMDTGDPQTIYLFNFNKRAILEYKRAIVEAKLRELTADENGLAESLEEAFQDIRGSFKPRRVRRPPPPPRKPRKEDVEQEEEVEDGEDIDEIFVAESEDEEAIDFSDDDTGDDEASDSDDED